MKMPKRCGNCGSEKLSKIDPVDTIALPWRDYPMVTLTEPIEGFKCTDCGELVLNASQAKGIDEKIVSSITHHIQAFLETIIQREHCEQRQIASHLGVSPEYLSEIKSGRKIPKFQTFNFLKTLAMNPSSFQVSAPDYKANERATG